jgi:hypothetical protein
MPTSFAGWYTLRGGKFVAVKETDNNGGTVCRNRLGNGPNGYSVTSDGTVSFTLSERATGSNPTQCLATSTAHATGVFQSDTQIEAVVTDSDASGWFVCRKRAAP